jgi:hypothetical protein
MLMRIIGVVHADAWHAPAPILAGGVSTSDPPDNPSSWLSDKLWGELCRLDAMGAPFAGVAADFGARQDEFKVGRTVHCPAVMVGEGNVR